MGLVCFNVLNFLRHEMELEFLSIPERIGCATELEEGGLAEARTASPLETGGLDHWQSGSLAHNVLESCDLCHFGHLAVWQSGSLLSPREESSLALATEMDRLVAALVTALFAAGPRTAVRRLSDRAASANRQARARPGPSSSRGSRRRASEKREPASS